MTDSAPGRASFDDWFLRDWMAHKHMKQADIARDLGWERGRVSKLYNGVQQYARTDVNALAAWLDIAPFELLMPPKEAMALRTLRETARLIASGEVNLTAAAPATTRRRAS